MFHPDAVRQAMPPLDWNRPLPSAGPVDEYCRFYALDEERRQPGVFHGGGWFGAAGYRLMVHVFRPPTPRGTVWILHGYLEHAGLWGRLLPQILRAGYAVLAFDLPGHGLSSGVRAGIGSFAEYQHILNDLLAAAEGRLPRPWRGVGQSTGGAILIEHVLARVARDEPPAFDRAFLMAPLVLPTRYQWWQIRVAFWFIRALRSGMPRNFRRNSSDGDFLNFVRHEDPLQARWLPLSWVMAMKEWIGHVHRLPGCSFPVWAVQGGRDETVNGRYNLAFVRSRFHVERELFLPEASHQLANERDDLRAPLDTLLQAFLASGGGLDNPAIPATTGAPESR